MQQPTQTTDSTRLYELLAWLELHRRQVIAGATIVLLLIVAAYIYTWKRDQNESAASSALLRLHTLPETADAKPSATAADLLKVAGEYPSTRAAERAQILAAGTLYSESRFADAQAEFERFLQSHGSSPLAAVAAYGAAASLDAQDKLDAALVAYQRVVADHPEDAVAGRARLGAAAIQETRNQPAEALKLYDEIAKPAAFGAAAQEAIRRKQRLLQQHPELVKVVPAPAPAVALTPTNLDLTPPAGAPATK